MIGGIFAGIVIAIIIIYLFWWYIESSFKAWSYLDTRIGLSEEEKNELTPSLPRWIADTWKPVFFNYVYYTAYYM
jgi:hypothetical protein